ncbi:VCBS domain-containing protein, partial [Zwartia sp.]|uniref:VCBS domain-containing protein n=1 Tax=Zwartia sp. TaxID=2978004 RepID=UPI0028AF270C
MLFDGAAAATPPESLPPPDPLPQADLAVQPVVSTAEISIASTSGMLNNDPVVLASTQTEPVQDAAKVIEVSAQSIEADDSADESVGVEFESSFEIKPLGVIAFDQEVDQTLSLSALKVETSLTTLLQAENWAEQLYALFPGDEGGMTQSWLDSAQAFRQGVLDGSLSVDVQLRVSGDMLGLNGAYAASGPEGTSVIYLNQDLLDANDQSYANAVLMEEVGHWIDHQINAHEDTKGDEGERFAAYMLNLQISELEANRIAIENDRIVLTIDGKEIEVEMASLLFGGQSYDVVGNQSLEENVLVVGAALPGTRTLLVSDPADVKWFSGNNVRGWLYVVNETNFVQESFYGEVSRLLKTASNNIVGIQFYVYPVPSAPSTGGLGQTLLVDLNANSDLVLIPGQTQRTSSDPVSTFLNSLLPANVAPIAVNDSGSASMASCTVPTPTSETTATGNVLSNDSGSNITYKIVGNQMVEDRGALSVTTIASSGTGASAVLTVGSTSINNGSTVTGTYGVLTIGADGTYSFNINENNAQLIALKAGQSVNETFTYTLSDSNGGTSSALLTVTINGGNEKPVAANDYQLLQEGASTPATLVTTTTTSGGLLLNDSDSDTGDSLVITRAEKASAIDDETFDTPVNVSASGMQSFDQTVAFTFNKAGQTSQWSASVGQSVFVSYDGGASYVDSGLFVKAIDNGGSTKTLSFKTTSAGSEDGFLYLPAVLTSVRLSFGGAGTSSSPTPTSALEASQTQFVLTGSTGTPSAGSLVTGEGLQSQTTVVSTKVVGAFTYVVLDKTVQIGVGEFSLSSGESLSFISGAIYGQYGYLDLKNDGSYSYVLTTNIPSNTQVNEYFTYEVRDLSGCTDTAVLHLQIQGDKVLPPVGVADLGNVTETGVSVGTSPISGSVLSNDTNTGGTLLTTATASITSVWSPANSASPSAITADTTSVTSPTRFDGLYGRLSIGADGSYIYTLDNSKPIVDSLAISQTLTEVFYYSVTNNATPPVSAVSTLTITINGANDAPVANVDTAVALEASGLANTTAGFNPTGNVLLNDTDVDNGDTRVVSAITGGTVGSAKTGSYGSIILNENGGYTYTLDNSNSVVEALKVGQSLTETFTYTVKDLNDATSTATLTITIRGADDTVLISDLFANEGSQYAVFSVQSGAGQELSLSLSAGSASLSDSTPAGDGTEDFGPSLQYLVGSTWTNYTSGFVVVPAGGILLVRSEVRNDSLLESASGETFTLTATNKGGTAYVATATILDDGTGTIFNADGSANDSAVKDDDRALSVNSITVNENSPHAVFTVT